MLHGHLSSRKCPAFYNNMLYKVVHVQHGLSDVTPFMQFQAAIRSNECHGRALHCSSEPSSFWVNSA